ncbi:MAG: hypothetical protein AB7K71_38575 [Polyangiaceae bacterium]
MRAKQCDAWFRRQHVLGEFIVDLGCPHSPVLSAAHFRPVGLPQIRARLRLRASGGDANSYGSTHSWLRHTRSPLHCVRWVAPTRRCSRFRMASHCAARLRSPPNPCSAAPPRVRGRLLTLNSSRRFKPNTPKASQYHCTRPAFVLPQTCPLECTTHGNLHLPTRR